MARRTEALILALAVSACQGAGQSIALPDTGRAFIVVLEGPTGELEAEAYEGPARLTLPPESLDHAYVLVLDHALSAFQITPGELRRVTREPTRPLPTPIEILERSDGAFGLAELEPESLDGFLLPAFDANACVDAGGCRLLEEEALNAPLCILPCPDPDAPAPPRAPAAPTPPEPVQLTPCPATWTETEPDPDGLVRCIAPSVPPSVGCGRSEAQAWDDPACRPIGPPCGADDWATALPVGANILYVHANAGPGGDGSRTAPFSTLAEAYAASGPNDVIALSKGRFEATLVVGVGQATAFTSRADALELRSLAVEQAAIAVSVPSGGRAILEDILIDGLAVRAIEVSGGELEASSLVVRGSSGLWLGPGSRATLADLVVEGFLDPALVVNGAEVAVERAAFRDAQDVGGTSHALLAVNGAQLDGRSLSIEGAIGDAVIAVDEATRLALSDFAVRDTRPESSMEVPRPIGFYGAGGVLARGQIEDTHRGVTVAGSDGLRLEDLSIELVPVTLIADEAQVGVEAFDVDTLELARVRIDFAERGLGVGATQVQDLSLEHVAVGGHVESVQGQVGCVLVGGSSQLQRVLIRDTQTALSFDEAEASVSDLELLRVGLIDENEDSIGGGLIARGSTVTGERFTMETAAMAVGGSNAVLDLSDLKASGLVLPDAEPFAAMAVGTSTRPDSREPSSTFRRIEVADYAVGLIVNGAHPLTLEDARFERQNEFATDDDLGAILVRGDGGRSVSIHRVAITGFEGGLVIDDPLSAPSVAEDVLVSGTGAHAIRIDGGEWTLRRVSVIDGAESGLRLGKRTLSDVTDLLIEGTGGPFRDGAGLWIDGGARSSITRFRLIGDAEAVQGISTGVGSAEAGLTELQLDNGSIQGFRIGLVYGVTDPATLIERVMFTENDESLVSAP